MKKFKIKLIFTVISLGVLVFLGGLSFFINNPIKQKLVVEAGETLDEMDFYKSPKIYNYLREHKIPIINCRLLTDLKEVNTGIVSDYSVEFLVNGKVNTTIVSVIDTVSPKLRVRDAVIIEGEDYKNSDFIEELEDETNVRIKVDGLKNYSGESGNYPVTIVAVDGGKNKTKKKANLVVLPLRKKLRVELGTEINFDKLKKRKTDIRLSYKDEDNLNRISNTLGKHKIKLEVDIPDKKYTIPLTIEVVDTTPPIIRGTKELYLYMGEPISYRKGVYVEDNQKEKIKLLVDASKINPKKEGKYKLIYKAIDKSANETTKEVNVRVVSGKGHYEEVRKYSKRILKKLFDQNIDDIEKLNRIFNYCSKNIRYTGYSNKEDLVEAAYEGFRTHTGDCFTYYAISHFLITTAGFEELMVKRAAKDSRHFWNLIKYKGEWYHFDTCPIYGAGDFKAFMLSDYELEKFSKGYTNKKYYEFDRLAYPKRAEKALQR